MESKKNIFILIPDNIDTPLGGVGVKWRYLITEFQKTFNIYLVCLTHKKLQRINKNKNGVLESIYISYDVDMKVKNVSIYNWIKSKRISDIDLVIAVDSTCIELALNVCSLFKCNLISCYDEPITSNPKEILSYMKKYLDCSSKVIYCSEYYHKIGFPNIERKTSIIYNGITIPEKSFPKFVLPGKNKVKILYLGRIAAPEKNVISLKRITEISNVDLILVGPATNNKGNNDLNYLLKSNNVYYLGVIDFDYKYSLINSVDAVIVPSINEPFNIVCLESIALGTPLITSFESGIKFWLPNNAALCCGTTENSVKNAVEKFIELPSDIKNEMISNGKYVSNNFTAEKMASEYIAEIYKVIR